MVQPPKTPTLKKYGLILDEWEAILERQNGVCFVCKKIPTTGRLCIDHEHVKGWKKLPPEQRKQYVRGLLCWWCNSRFLSRGITLEKLRNAALYIETYNARGRL